MTSKNDDMTQLRSKKRVHMLDIKEEQNGFTESKWRLAKEIGYQGLFRLGWARAVAANESNEILVADHTASQVKMYNREGYLLDTVPSRYHSPLGVAAAPDGRVFVANTNCVQVFSSINQQTWQKVFEFPPSVTCRGINEHPEIVSISLSEDKTKILVGTRFPEFITVFDIKDGRPCGDNPSIPIQICPSFIASGPSGQIIVSSYGVEDEVHIIDANGKLLFKLDPPEGLDSWIPSGVYYNKEGASGQCCYFIANWAVTGRGIYCYSTTGRIQGVITQEVYNPQGLCMTGDNKTLLVADDKSVKIFELCTG